MLVELFLSYFNKNKYLKISCNTTKMYQIFSRTNKITTEKLRIIEGNFPLCLSVSLWFQKMAFTSEKAVL
jgi:hypothetical protein